MSMEKARELAKRGADYLDSRSDEFDELEGWRSKIDRATFDIDHTKKCVIGQLFGDYTFGRQRLGLASVGCYELGFSPDFSEATVRELNIAWREMLSESAPAKAGADDTTRGKVYELLRIADAARRIGAEAVAQSALDAAVAEALSA